MFPLRLPSCHLPSKPRIILQSALTVAIGIGLEFILVLIVVLTPHPTLNPVGNPPPRVNLVPAPRLCLILKTAAAKKSSLILELVVITGKTQIWNADLE